MSTEPSVCKLDGKTGQLFRRDHLKVDGRLLSLYGFEPNSSFAHEELLRTETISGEVRYNPLRNSWAVYAPHRQSRTFQPPAAEDPLAPAKAGSALTEIPFEDFEVAVFENRFPSLSSSTGKLSSWATAPACGRCEVVVYTKEATGNLATISEARRVLLIEALIDRYQVLKESGFAYVMPFENRGEAVGVTLSHPHGQIYAFSDIPEPQAAAVRAFESGYDLIAHHKSWCGNFDVAEEDNLVAFCPPFARFPYETWIMPKYACSSLCDLDAKGVRALATMLADIPRRLDALFDQPMPYMMSFQAAPFSGNKNFQFTVQFLPIRRAADRLKYLASVEQFTDVFTVDVVPEKAAAVLREL